MSNMAATVISKTDIIKEIAHQVPGSEASVKEVLEAFWKTVVGHVEKGEEVRFLNLGKFYKAHRAERMGRNPKTGESAVISARRVTSFRPCTEFRERVAK